jgi:hypothetical protein
LKNEKEENNMAKNYVDEKNMEEVGLTREEDISKRNEKERQENDGQRYRDTYSENGEKEYQQRYGDTSPENVEKEYQPKNGVVTKEKQEERYDQKGGQKESPGNQRNSN